MYITDRTSKLIHNQNRQLSATAIPAENEAAHQKALSHRCDMPMNLEDLYRLLRNAHVQTQGMVDTIPEPLLVLDQNLCVETANRAFFETFKLTRDETIGRPLYELGNGQWNISELRLLLEAVIPKSTAVIGFEVDNDFPGLGDRNMLVSARRLFHPDNNSMRLLLWIEDVTIRVQREKEKDLLLGELRHRMKNLLALVQSLARQTAVEGRTATEYRDSFLGRFQALAQAHEIAFAQQGGAQLNELVERTLQPYSTDQMALVLESGPTVTLRAAQVTPVNMILHELATNAVKHGAFSTSGGQVRVSWTVETEKGIWLHLRWQERGGPPIEPPTVRGFGIRLIEFAAIKDLEGRAELTFGREGLVAQIVLPLT